jgi:hypothetical protein
VQYTEHAYWTGPTARRIAREAWLVDERDVAHLALLADAGRVTFATGDVRIGPGLHARLVSGHTAGTQLVTVRTPAGRLVLASDAIQFYEKLDTDRPGPIAHRVPDAYAAFDRARDLAEGGRSCLGMTRRWRPGSPGRAATS